MKVFYIGSFGLPYSTEVFVEWALKQHGVEVYRWPCLDGSRNYRGICQELKKQKPDVVLFAKATPARTHSLLVWCRQHNILTVCWLWDLYWGHRRSRPKQFRADLLFTTDGGHDKEFVEYSCNHSVLRQGIHEPDHHIYPPAYTHDVAFVGGSGRTYPDVRNSLVKWLARTYNRKAAAISDRFIHHTNVRRLALNQALAQVRVVVGDSYTTLPYYWSNRVYEIIGRGGFLLHPQIVGLNEEFADGRHYATYRWNDYNHLKSRIEYWLAHDEEREAIRRQGFAHCGACHTYTRRVTVLLDRIRAALAFGGP